MQVLTETLFFQRQPNPGPGVPDLRLDLVHRRHVVHDGHDGGVEGRVGQTRIDDDLHRSAPVRQQVRFAPRHQRQTEGLRAQFALEPHPVLVPVPVLEQVMPKSRLPGPVAEAVRPYALDEVADAGHQHVFFATGHAVWRGTADVAPLDGLLTQLVQQDPLRLELAFGQQLEDELGVGLGDGGGAGIEQRDFLGGRRQRGRVDGHGLAVAPHPARRGGLSTFAAHPAAGGVELGRVEKREDAGGEALLLGFVGLVPGRFLRRHRQLHFLEPEVEQVVGSVDERGLFVGGRAHEGLAVLVSQPAQTFLEGRGVGVAAAGPLQALVDEEGEHLGLEKGGQEGQVSLDLVGEEGDLVEVLLRVCGLLRRQVQVVLVRVDDEVRVGEEQVGEAVDKHFPDGVVEAQAVLVAVAALLLTAQRFELGNHEV